MRNRTVSSTMPVLPVSLVLVLLVAVSGLANAEPGGLEPITEVARLTASDGAEGDIFGYSVSISGDTLIAGAFGDGDSGDKSGSVYVFEREPGGLSGWVQVAKLTASDGAEWDHLGWAVSISGDTVVAGAHFDADAGASSGSAYLFERPGTGWEDMTETTKLTASDAASGDLFGYAVAIDGDTVVVGAFEDDDHGQDSGSVYLFEKPVTGWPASMTETSKLGASDGAAGDYLGRSVAISGDTVVSGAPEDDDNGDRSGSVYLFEMPGTGWPESMTETSKLTASDGAEWDRLGGSVSISGETVVAGAENDADSGFGTGSAYLFEQPGSGWPGSMTETANLTASDGAAEDWFGHAVAVSGDTVVAGAFYDDDKGGNSGSVYVFEEPELGWANMTETFKLIASDGAADDQFGRAVSISRRTVVVGAEIDPDSSEAYGRAYVFFRFRPVGPVYLPVVLRSGL